MIAAALLSASSSSSTSSLTKSSSTMATATISAMKTGEQQVRTLIPVTAADGSKMFVSGPCIVLKANTGVTLKPPAMTVAQQMQALRPLIKADTNTLKSIMVKKCNDRNNNSNNTNKSSSTAIINKVAAGPTESKITSNTKSNSSSSATSPDSNTENEPHEALRCKRRIDFSSLGLPRPQPAAMARRNERERNRVKQVNQGFETLRQHVPQGRKNKKLSKVDTLKEAVKYIRYLHQLLVEADDDQKDDEGEDVKKNLTAVSDIVTTVTFNPSSPAVSTISSLSPVKDANIKISSPSSLVSASTNTTAASSGDFLQLASDVTNTSSDRLAVSDSGAMDYTRQHTTELAFEDEIDGGVFMYNNINNSSVQMGSSLMQFAQHISLNSEPHVTNSAMDIDAGKGSPSSQLNELAPAQISFLESRSLSTSSVRTASTAITASDMDLDHIHVTHDRSTSSSAARRLGDQFTHYNTSINADNNGNNLPQFSAASMHFLDFSSSTLSPSPGDYSHIERGQLNDVHSLTQHQNSCYPVVPQSTRGSAEPDYGSQVSVCGVGSEGSCPVSPSESSEMSHEETEAMGMNGGETWQDLTAVAEWLCSKFDIEAQDAFV